MRGRVAAGQERGFEGVTAAITRRAVIAKRARTAVIVAALDTRPAKSSLVAAIGALIVTVAVIALFAGVVVKLAVEVWEGRHSSPPGTIS
jgi:hypothetical protein